MRLQEIKVTEFLLVSCRTKRREIKRYLKKKGIIRTRYRPFTLLHHGLDNLDQAGVCLADVLNLIEKVITR